MFKSNVRNVLVGVGITRSEAFLLDGSSSVKHPNHSIGVCYLCPCPYIAKRMVLHVLQFFGG